MKKAFLALILPALLLATLTNPTPANAAGNYYRLQTRLEYNGTPLCIQGNGQGNTVTLAVCSTSSRQKFAYYNLNGYPVLANVGYSPALALNASAYTAGTNIGLQTIAGNAHQGWYWDSAYTRGGAIWLASHPGMVLEPRSVTPGAIVELQVGDGKGGTQGWKMYPW